MPLRDLVALGFWCSLVPIALFLRILIQNLIQKTHSRSKRFFFFFFFFFFLGGGGCHAPSGSATDGSLSGGTLEEFNNKKEQRGTLTMRVCVCLFVYLFVYVLCAVFTSYKFSDIFDNSLKMWIIRFNQCIFINDVNRAWTIQQCIPK